MQSSIMIASISVLMVSIPLESPAASLPPGKCLINTVPGLL